MRCIVLFCLALIAAAPVSAEIIGTCSLPADETPVERATSCPLEIKGPPVPARQVDDDPIDRLIGHAVRYLGTIYRRGGSSRHGFDCSGFTSYLFAKLGLEIPRTSASQLQVGTPVRRGELQKGDLVFFKGRNSRSSLVGHVGLVISKSGEPARFIHASPSRGIAIDTIDSPYFTIRYLAGRRPVELAGTREAEASPQG